MVLNMIIRGTNTGSKLKTIWSHPEQRNFLVKFHNMSFNVSLLVPLEMFFAVQPLKLSSNIQSVANVLLFLLS